MNFAISNLSEVWRPYAEQLQELADSMESISVSELRAVCSEELSELFDEDELELL